MKTISKASFKKWQALPSLSLTPALSLWEGENPPLPQRKRKLDDCPESAGKTESRRPPLPFPHNADPGERVKSQPSANFSKDHD